MARLPLLVLVLAVVSCLALGARSSADEASSRWQWEGVERVVAIGDLHGWPDKMVALLEGLDLVDGRRDWTGGTAHLVLCGDLVDRGPGDRSVLDLARKLERQAEAAGGRVHVLLGNHEVMNLTRDLRYVSRESFGEFAEDEARRARRRGLSNYLASFANRGGRPGEIQTAFDEAYPPGYFAHLEALAPGGEYGGWLLKQPTVVKVNGVLFVHGGLTPEVAAFGLEEINRRTLAAIRAFVDAREQLGGEVPWPRTFNATLATAREIVEEARPEAINPVLGAARRLLDLQDGLPFSPSGPVWYRGSSIEDEKLERENVQRVLELLQARAQVVGHTVTRSQRINTRFDGRLVRTDVGMGYGRPAFALVLEDGEFRTFDARNRTFAAPLIEAPQGEGWPQGEEELSDETLEAFLTRAAVTATREVELEGVPFRLLELELHGIRLRAAFGTGQESAASAAAAGRAARRGYQNQVAAYRVDRLLNLGMVPVSVPRTVGGEPGMVQVWMQSAIDLNALGLFGGVSFLEGLETQVAQARAFSALIGTAERMNTGRMLLPVSRRVVLADNGIAFPDVADAGRYLPEGCGPVGPAFLTALRALDADDVTAELSGLLAPAQVTALLERRDALVELCAEPRSGWSIAGVLAQIDGG